MKLLGQLNNKSWGALELLFAFQLIIQGYKYGPITLGLVNLILMMALALIRRKQSNQDYPVALKLLFGYMIIHELVLFFIVGVSKEHMMGSMSSLILNVMAVFIVAPKMELRKFYNAIMLVAVISCLGMIYHFVLLMEGRTDITPLTLPFLPIMDEGSRAFEIIKRPTSFYWEPASFITFMLIPFFIKLIQRDYKWAIAFLFCILISTSTNGIVLSAIILFVYIFTTKLKLKYRIWTLVIGIGLFSFMFRASLFDDGVDKLKNQDYESNVRLQSGPIILSQMNHYDYVFGAPYQNVDDMLLAEKIITPWISLYNSQFVSAFWLIIIKFGTVGIFLYLLLFYQLYKKNKLILPYLVTLLVASFSQGIMPGNTSFTFQIVCLYVLIAHSNIFNLDESKIKRAA